MIRLTKFFLCDQDCGDAACLGSFRRELPNDDHLPPARPADVLLLLQGHQGPLEVHQEHDRPDQHPALQHGEGGGGGAAPGRGVTDQLRVSAQTLHHQDVISSLSWQISGKSDR